MEKLPDAVLVDVMSFLPGRAYLPLCHVNKRFKDTWVYLKRLPTKRARAINKKYSKEIESAQSPGRMRRRELIEACISNPVRNLLDHSTTISLPLRVPLLEYYISCGWRGDAHFKVLLYRAIARGDIHGVTLLVDRGLCKLDDEEICSVAASAGQLDTLLWLRQERGCPWKPVEAYQRASENFHHSVMKYVYLSSDDSEIGVGSAGMPW
eukprot:CAMPEP_0113546692 /NCGR_PEP_ID=MMETSP0015_2-20120614/11944_1 /TAXON_ID=2838 /ORGANISM="Odontella" /LENGTH=208 /DNA_ID=CAMNT_0000447169 /DNA_START=241 /DNA_END=867 /DNA_ORIENTATION=+ /assembly_acc=CAM_ASM_000160